VPDGPLCVPVSLPVCTCVASPAACVLRARLVVWYSASCFEVNHALPQPSPPPSLLACRDNYWAKLLLPFAILIMGFKFSHSYPPYKRKQMLASMQQSDGGI
jgi:hypothetical protein